MATRLLLTDHFGGAARASWPYFYLIVTDVCSSTSKSPMLNTAFCTELRNKLEVSDTGTTAHKRDRHGCFRLQIHWVGESALDFNLNFTGPMQCTQAYPQNRLCALDSPIKVCTKTPRGITTSMTSEPPTLVADKTFPS